MTAKEVLLKKATEYNDGFTSGQYNRILKYASDRRMQFLRGTQDFLTRNGYLDNYSFDKFGMVDSVHNLLEFTEDGVIHRKGSTQLVDGKQPAAIPLSMTRGSLIVKANPWTPETGEALWSCSHGAGRLKSRTDTLKHWHSLKKAEKEEYKQNFSEMLNRSGEFDSSLIQEFDFAYKDSSTILETQPYLIRLAETSPIVTVKFTAV
jgi:tRNA-splicing ligase RtcB/release factor H-coupled RctB family protein